MESLELSNYNHTFGIKNKVLRLLWNIVYYVAFRPFGTRLFKKWRILILKSFGAEVKWSSHIYASVKIWAPWNLKMGSYSTLGPHVDCYNQGIITIGNNTVVSQKSYLCASSHDYKSPNFPLVLKPIKIGNGVWIATAAFVGPNVNIADNAVVGARAVVVTNVVENTIVGGNPAKFIKKK